MCNLAKAVSLQSFNSVGCLGQSFTEGLQKHNDDVIITSFHTFWIRISIYYGTSSRLINLSKFQISELSESNFTEVGIRHPKIPIRRHYDISSQYLVFKITHFVEYNTSYQSAKYHWSGLFGSNFTREVGKHPLPRIKILNGMGDGGWKPSHWRFSSTVPNRLPLQS